MEECIQWMREYTVMPRCMYYIRHWFPKLCLASSLSRSGYCGLVPLLRLVSRSQTVIFCFILGRETQYKKEKIIAVWQRVTQYPKSWELPVIVGDTHVDSTYIFTLYAMALHRFTRQLLFDVQIISGFKSIFMGFRPYCGTLTGLTWILLQYVLWGKNSPNNTSSNNSDSVYP